MSDTETTNLRTTLQDKVTCSPEEAARLLSVSRPTIYVLLREGRLRAGKLGRRRLVSIASIRTLHDELVGQPQQWGVAQ